MNYLISAYSVNPYLGSEDSIGWNWVLQYEKNCNPGDRIILLTKRFNEADTRRGMQEYGIQHVELEIVDVPNALNWFREKHSVFHHMYYILWQYWAWLWVKHSGIVFDVIHHVTMCDYRIPSQMHRAKGAKVIWGPVGGAQVTPKALREYETSTIWATLREVINRSCSWNPFYKKTLQAYHRIYCINQETQRQIGKVLGKEAELLPELAIRESHRQLVLKEKQEDLLRIVYVGRLIPKKGVLFLLDVLTRISLDQRWELQIFGDGPDRPRIERKIAENGLAGHVKLMGKRTLAQIGEAYEQADIFVLPSLRETSGNVLVEAMANGLPVVALDMSFCSQLKEVGCGIFVNTQQSTEELLKEFCAAIETLGADPQLRLQMGMRGYRWVNEVLTWDNKMKIIMDGLRNS